MTSDEEREGAKSPEGETSPPGESPSAGTPEENGSPPPPSQEEARPSSDAADHPEDDLDEYDEDSYAHGSDSDASVATVEEKPAPPAPAGGGESGATPPPPAEGEGDDDGGDGGGMLRMSFLEHLEELRRRLLLSLAGIGVAFVVCLVFANQLWLIVSEPAVEALRRIGADPHLAQIDPMDAFKTIWVKVPMLAAIFLASPWVLYQVWAFIAPGLYKRERRWASPFVISTAGLFILGGLFAYFVAFRFGLAFLLSIGQDINVKPVVSLTHYFNLFVNVILGIGLVFELPVLLFFLTLLRVVSPRFLLRNTRYAVLIIVVLAAVITPTPDIFNLMLFSLPMCLLYFVGIFASYLLILHREKRGLPWRAILYGLLVALVLIAAAVYLAITQYGYRVEPRWPFLVQ
jgi:sec-independent protein translocase protein TatC